MEVIADCAVNKTFYLYKKGDKLAYDAGYFLLVQLWCRWEI
jgi:hypothetical protein